eukprot:9701131-Alexandrium_andersonii.AAC.1
MGGYSPDPPQIGASSTRRRRQLGGPAGSEASPRAAGGPGGGGPSAGAGNCRKRCYPFVVAHVAL